MELFLQLFFTILLSIILSFFISKLLSWDSTSDRLDPDSASNPSEFVIDKTSLCDRNTEESLKSCDAEGEKRVRFVDEIAIHEVDEVDELKVRSRDVFDDDDEEVLVDEFREVVVVGGVEERLIEESLNRVEVKGGESDVREFREESVNDCVNVIEHKLLDESPESRNKADLVKVKAKGEISLAKNEEVGVLECEGHERNDDIDEMNRNEMDDDWEGIERTELEKQFSAAVVFVGCSSNVDCISKLGNDVQMQLYGLHKVATEGSCHESQPMAFKMSARSKWNAWQQLGNTSPEAAMEQYISLLSQNIPGWLGADPDGKL